MAEADGPGAPFRRQVDVMVDELAEIGEQIRGAKGAWDRCVLVKYRVLDFARVRAQDHLSGAVRIGGG